MPNHFQNPVMFMYAGIVHEWQYTPCKENSPVCLQYTTLLFHYMSFYPLIGG